MFEIIKDMWNDGIGGKVLFFCIVFLILLIPAMIWLLIENQKQWEKFKIKHNCQVVSKIRGGTSVGSGVSSSGKPGVVIVQEPDKTGWLCDDGITYYR